MMRGLAALTYSALLISGCKTPPVDRPQAVGVAESTSQVFQNAKVPSQLVLFGDGHREWLDGNGTLHPIMEKTPAPEVLKAVDMFLAANHLDWSGDDRSYCLAGEGTYVVFTRDNSCLHALLLGANGTAHIVQR